MPRLPLIRLYVGISTVFVSLTIVIVGSVVWNTYRETRLTALNNAEQLFQEVTTKVVERVKSRLDSVSAVVDAIGSVPSLSQEPVYDGLDHPGIGLLIEILDSRPHSYAAFVGYGDGSFFQVTPSRGNPRVLAVFEAPEQTAYVIRSITRDIDGRRKQYLRFLDAQRQVIGARTEAEPSYDPRSRPWYTLGLGSTHAALTEPYIFFSLRQPGFTVTRRVTGGGVLGLDVSLEGLSAFLAEQGFAERSKVFIFDREGRLLAHPDATLVTTSRDQGGTDAKPGFARVADSRNPLVRAIGRTYLEQQDKGAGIRSHTIGGDRQLYTVRSMSVGSGTELLVVASAPLRAFTAPFLLIQHRNLVFAAIVLAAAIPIIILLARQISRKLADLELETEQIQRFELDKPVTINSPFREIHSLSAAFASMKGSMYTFGRYVPKDLVRQILTAGGDAEPGGQRRELTLMFTDVADFTTLSEGMDPEALMLHVSAYFDAMAEAIAHHRGVIDKYIGDAVMAFWNAPHRDDHHVSHACAAVLECRLVNERMNADRGDRERPRLHTRFGLHTGQVVVGNIGGRERMNYTAVGASVNVASRLEGLNKVYGTQILVSDATRARAGNGFLFRSIDRALPKGAKTPLEICELMGAVRDNTQVPKSLWANDRAVRLASVWRRAYELYVARDWPSACAAFEDIEQQFPDDRPAALLARRCQSFVSEPPPASWDGVTKHQQK